MNIENILKNLFDNMKHCLSLKFILICISSGCIYSRCVAGPAIEWSTLPDLPQGAFGHSVFLWNDMIIAAGGTTWHDGKKCWISESYKLTKNSSKWENFKSLPLKYAYGATGCYNNKLIVSGGNTTEGMAIHDTFQLELKAPEPVWKKTGTLSTAMIYPATTNETKYLYAFGGLTEKENWKTANSELRRLNMEIPGDGWKKLKPLPGAGRALSGLCAHNGKLYIFGGVRLNDSGNLTNLAECWSFNLVKNEWKQLSDIPSAARCSLALPWKRWIFLFAGCITDREGNEVISDKIYLYDMEDNVWSEFGKAPYPAAVTGMIRDGEIYLIGGEDKKRSRAATCVQGIIKEKN